jgi:ribosome maturation factor RimP
MYFCGGFREGDSVPFFISMMKSMISNDLISELAQSFLKDTANYLIQVNVRSGNRISVFIENDDHVSIKDCIALSRHIESNLDREKQDFELEVSSPGIDSPFKNIRQYKKYVGKDVEVIFVNGEKIQGVLLGADEAGFDIKPLPPKSKKNNQQANDILPVRYSFDEVKETKLVITF